MRRIIALAALVAIGAGSAFAADPVVQKFELSAPSGCAVPYEGAQASKFSGGLPLGVGSSLTFIGKTTDGALRFWGITDRGPNADSPDILVDGASRSTKIFVAPTFTPSLALIEVKDGKAAVVKTVALSDRRGQTISGLPLPPGEVGATGEAALDDSLMMLPYDKEGLDTEGVDIDPKDGSLWLCDEYGPFIAKVNPKTGRAIAKYAPGKGLPSILAKRQPNRGFEGLAVTPSGKVLAAVQSILDVDGKVKKSAAPFIRLALLNPANGSVKMLAYPHDVSAYKKSADAKIGDLAALSENSFLIVEQGKGADKKMRNLVYRIDIDGATDLTGVKTAEGKEPEAATDLAALGALGVKPVKKTLVLDLKALGWEPEKAEGLAVLDGGKTLAVASDNDFGFAGRVANPESGKDDPTDYVIAPDKTLTIDGKSTSCSIAMKPTGEPNVLWLVTLPKPASEY